MQDWGAQLLHFLDGQERLARRRDIALLGAVITDALTPKGIGLGLRDAWPEFFTTPDDLAFPSTGADMSDFTWERPTPGSYQGDLDAIMAANQVISVPESPPSAPAPSPEPDLEWS